MDLYSLDEIGSRGRGPSINRAGIKRGETQDPFGGVVVQPSRQALPMPKQPPPPRVASLSGRASASGQSRSQEIAEQKLAAQLAEAQKMLRENAGFTPSRPAASPRSGILEQLLRPAAQATSPTTKTQSQQTPTQNQNGTSQVPSKSQSGYMGPEDAWLARMGINADMWLDLHPFHRAHHLHLVGCVPSEFVKIGPALDAWCSKRTGRSPIFVATQDTGKSNPYAIVRPSAQAIAPQATSVASGFGTVVILLGLAAGAAWAASKM